MSVFDQFQHLLVRRTLHRSINAPREIKRVPSITLLNFNSLSNSIYNNMQEAKGNASPQKNNPEKYQDIRKRFTSRASEKPRRRSVNIRPSNVFEENQPYLQNIQLTSNTLSCTKAIVYTNQRAQENQWRQTWRNEKEWFKNTITKDQKEVTSYLRSPTKSIQKSNPTPISPQTPNRKILTEKRLRIKTVRKMSETLSSFAFESSSKKIQSSLNFVKSPPTKQICNRSFATKDTKCSDEISVGQIDAWNCQQGFVDDLEL